MSVERYEAGEIVVEFDPQRCIGAGECSRGLPSVFNAQARPWIQPQNADSAEIADVVRRCPSGALAMHFKHGRAAEQPDAVNTVTITPDGPLHVRGRIVYSHGSHAAPATYTRVALCRCGASANKPFCDGSHESAGFGDAGGCHARERDRPAAPQPPAGAIRLNPIANGPLMVEGWLEIRAADGSTLVVGDKCWLCRCGHSRHKPFCDGSHKAAGFAA